MSALSGPRECPTRVRLRGQSGHGARGAKSVAEMRRRAESSMVRAVSECIDHWRIRAHCCVEAPKNSLLPSLRQFSAVDRPVVNETDGDWATGYSAAHALAKAQRRATRERRIHGVAIDIAHLGGCFVA